MQNGWISEYEIYVSDDSVAWGNPIHRGNPARNNDRSTISFRKPAQGRYVRFVAIKGIDGQKFASIAELDIVPSENPDIEQ